jgi:hypothetical protein
LGDGRKAIIIQEIKYWKQHRLLPEHYCDYLLALYTGGEGVIEDERLQATNQPKRKQGLERFQLFLLFLLLPFSFVVLYFTEVPDLLQLVMLFLFLSYSIWTITYFQHKGNFYVQASLVISLFLLLFLSIFMLDLLFEQAIAMTIGVFLNFLLWIVVGSIFRYYYLVVIAATGILFIIVYHFI